MEERLTGGNTHEAIVRVGGTVRRPIGAATPGVHALLGHLEHAGFTGAPRVLGIDEQRREVLTFAQGEVVWPDHFDLVGTDRSLAAVAELVRQYHDAVSGFDWRGYSWSDRGQDPSGEADLLCHNDLAPWNLVHRDSTWTFIDWDLAAPGRRGWDIAWALLSFVPLMPNRGIDDEAVVRRLRVFATAYGNEHAGAPVIDTAVERCVREADLISTLGRAGKAPYRRLLAEGHHDVWAEAAEHVSGRAEGWKAALA